jgi:glutaredoxin
MNKVKVFGADWCEDTQRTREHLDKREVPYEYINVDHDKAAEAWIKEQNRGKRKTPTVDFGGKILIEPTDDEVDEALKGT